LYAFVMGWPEREAVIPTLALGGTNQVGKIRGVTLLGHRGNLKFTQDEQSLRVTLPPEKPCEHSVCFKIAGA
jgi:alpha-L-fucosidase